MNGSSALSRNGLRGDVCSDQGQADWQSQAGVDVRALLAGARRGDALSLNDLLARFRNYLLLVARTQIEHRLQPRVSPSDVVQETMLRAHRHFAQFRGESEQELLAWLRQIVLTSLARFVERYMLAAKRDIRREVSLERWGARLGDLGQLPGALRNPPAPSTLAEQREEAALLADRMGQLPPPYRDVLVLRNMQGLSFEAIAGQLDRSPGATRMLWLRAIEKLRDIYRRAEEQDA